MPVPIGLTEEDVPDLDPLSPKYEPGEHEDYVKILLREAALKGPSAPRNIALTGHYGSGKSSVLGEFERRMRRGVVNLSLSSLGADEGDASRVGANGETPALTNLIQKEIVKQLLYLEPPARMRASRFRRIDRFRVSPAIIWCFLVAVVAAALALYGGADAHIASLLPRRLLATHKSLPTVVVLLAALTLGVMCFLALKGLHNRVWIEKLSAGAVAVQLNNTANSYFDEYLDEIVYFFQRTGTTTAIFEDLDRFRDPHIFETLRELNTLLNNSQQLPRKPIRFIYAIRDSIFEQLEIDPISAAEPDAVDRAGGQMTNAADVQVPRDRTAAQKTTARALPTLSITNRTKFFDLVIPIVPFVSHRTSRDFLKSLFHDVTGVDESAIEVVAPHLTDMRLMKNIRNEYEIFSRRILPPRGLEALDANRLFAMIVYKNVHMADFERIREGRSRIDAVYSDYRHLINHQSELALTRASDAARRRTHADGFGERGERLKRRLMSAIDALFGIVGWSIPKANLTVQIAGEAFGASQFATAAFWKKVASVARSGPGVLRAQNQHGQHLELTRLQFEEILGEPIDPDDWLEADRGALQSEREQALADERLLSRASLAEMMEQSSFTLDTVEGPKSMREIAVATLPSQLAVDLVASGLLDENFALYTAQFKSEIASVPTSAMNYILHFVQLDTPDARFHFSSPSDIDALIREEGDRLLRGRAIFNIEIFDRLLDQRPDLLRHAIDTLLSGTHEVGSFLDLYIGTGAKAEKLIELATPRWPNVFEYLAELEDVGHESVPALLDAALSAVEDPLAYSGDAGPKWLFERRYSDVSALTVPGDPAQAARIAKLFRHHEVSVSDLSLVAEPQRREFVEQSVYPIDLRNLLAALQPWTKEIALDAIKGTSHVLYQHVCDNIANYLEAAAEAGSVTVGEPREFAGVVNDFAGHAAGTLFEIVRRADHDCVVIDLDDVKPEAWPTLADANRFRLTAHNLARYFEVSDDSVDEHLASILDRQGTILDAADLLAPERQRLALVLANDAHLDPDSRVGLVRSLNPGELDPADLNSNGVVLLPELLEQGMVADDQAAFTRLAAEPWKLKEQFIGVSAAFPGYLTQLNLPGVEVCNLVLSAHVPKAARAAALAYLSSFGGAIEAQTATEIAKSAIAFGDTLPLASIRVLAEAGTPIELVLQLLKPALPAADLAELSAVLNEFGAEYTRLTVTGDRKVHYVDAIEGVEALLARLQELGTVSSFVEDAAKERFRVRMKRG
jgi:hypothetical protein